jgi:hypothetical protein
MIAKSSTANGKSSHEIEMSARASTVSAPTSIAGIATNSSLVIVNATATEIVTVIAIGIGPTGIGLAGDAMIGGGAAMTSAAIGMAIEGTSRSATVGGIRTLALVGRPIVPIAIRGGRISPTTGGPGLLRRG